MTSPNDRAKAIYNSYSTDPLITGYVKNEHAVATFWDLEPTHNIDVTPQLKCLRELWIPVYALYGKQNGLYSNEQIGEIERVIGSDTISTIGFDVTRDRKDYRLSSIRSHRLL